MGDKTTRRGASAASIIAVAALVVMLALYVLSMGPAARLYMLGWFPMFNEVYAPVYWFENQVPRSVVYFDWYINVWIHDLKIGP